MPGFIGLPEIILLGLVALILFGPKRLPEMGRGLGKGMREFKESIGGYHGLNEAKLDVPTELTVPEPIATAAADRRNAA
jgi:sec-independent protein translocase protein TatA